jgi:4-amino-4-deoxy-L-arabinose transferase-like glycosyltransferase
VAATTKVIESREALEPAPASPTPRGRPLGQVESRFWVGIAGAVAVGATVRFVYLFHGAPRWPGGDGFGYYLDALRLADGLGYTSSLGDVGAQLAHHPPGWVTLLAGVTEAGWRSMWAFQVTGVVIGLALIVMAGLVGRRYAGGRVGVIAALVAAVYPGFWVLEPQILSEPLGLLLVGALMLVLADLWEGPTLWRAALAGAVTGAVGLVRSEQFVLLVIAVVPTLLLNRRLSTRRRLALTGAAILSALVVIAPWTIYNLGRFEEPVLLSTNIGGTVLAGNCPPTTYGGQLLGSYDTQCVRVLGLRARDRDRSQLQTAVLRQAITNMRDNIDRLPATVLARHGRLVGAFNPSQTVRIAADWLNSAAWPVWAWVASFWLVAPLAAYGGVVLRRSRTFMWPAVAPLVVVVMVVTIAYGEPRYHTPADLGLVVLAAVAIADLVRPIGALWSSR